MSFVSRIHDVVCRRCCSYEARRRRAEWPSSPRRPFLRRSGYHGGRQQSKVVGLVYVAAFAPDKGESAVSQGKPYGPTAGVGELRYIGDGFLLLDTQGVAEDFAPDLSSQERLAIEFYSPIN